MDQPQGIPARLSTFIGRKKETAELRRLLTHTRLLTILGPGGSGKTRLATEFARQQASRFGDGQVLAQLVEVRDPALVPDAIARAAGVRLQAEDGVGTLTRSLQSREMLLIVDNCEHLIDAAANVVSRLLVGCPHMVVVTTSRERLNIEGETAWSLPALTLPATADSLEAASVTEAVRLFVDRARSARPGFDLDRDNLAAVGAICRHLDGMPLAIELAAARTTTLSPGEIMARLDDRIRLLIGGARDADSRHRTLRATIDWSYALLDTSERILLHRLSIFAGPIRSDAIEETCGDAPLDRPSIIDGLQRLVDKSMLQAEPGVRGWTRYRLLETIRDYAAAKMAASAEEDGVRNRQRGFYARLAKEAFEKRLHRGAMAEHNRLWDEMADVRAALDWAKRDLDVEVELLGNLRLLWIGFAPAEGRRRLMTTLSGVPPKPVPGYVRAFWCLQALLGRSGHPERAEVNPQQLSDLAREAGEDVLVGMGYLGIAYVAERLDRDLDRAREYLEKAVREFTRFDDLPDMAMALSSLGCIEMQLGNLDRARPWIERGLEAALQAEDDYGVSGAYFTQGWLEILCGNSDAALHSFRAALDVVVETDLPGISDQAQGIAAVIAGTEARRALILFGAASRLREEAETPAGIPWSIWLDPVIAGALGALPSDAANKAWESGRLMTNAQVLAMAREGGAPWRGNAKARKGAGGLSKRELEVARLVASGMTSRAIAERLFLSERTVESHLGHILTKLDFDSRSQVATWVTEQGTRR
jgi:predicted ATPase/DNA-binding CsgD family transcriptional regulator